MLVQCVLWVMWGIFLFRKHLICSVANNVSQVRMTTFWHWRCKISSWCQHMTSCPIHFSYLLFHGGPHSNGWWVRHIGPCKCRHCTSPFMHNHVRWDPRVITKKQSMRDWYKEPQACGCIDYAKCQQQPQWANCHERVVSAVSTLTLSLLRVINVKIPLQPHKKYDITQNGELDFS